VNDRLRELVGIDGMQFGFMPGRGTTYAIFILNQGQGTSLEGMSKVYCGFVDLNKAYDRVHEEVVYCFRGRVVPERLVRTVELMYKWAKTLVRTWNGCLEAF